MQGRFKIFSVSISTLILFFAAKSQAVALTNVAVDTETVSAYKEEGATKKIFGGYTGTNGTCGTTASPVATSVCNTCSDMLTLGGLTRGACNPRNVHESLLLKISFTTTETPASGAEIKAKIGDNFITLGSGTSTTLAANTTLVATMTWGNICSAAKSTTCASAGNFNGTLTVGINDGASSSNIVHAQTFTLVFESPSTSPGYVRDCEVGNGSSSEGFCFLTGYPGDEKVYFEGIKRADTIHGGTARFKALRIYYVEGNNTFSSIPIATAPYQDLAVQDLTITSSSLDPNSVSGLTNDVTYSFAFASVDEAENVLNFSDPAELTAAQHSIKPQSVVGLLENKKCFIATAAYGSPWDKNVNILRAFKNKVLLKSKLGERFVRFYYKHSPAIANEIEKNEFLKAGVRVVLTPWVWMATVANLISDALTGEGAQ